MLRTFLHLDLDQFFVSVERLRDPSLCGRPVCVGGSDPSARGAVACASYEARAFGVRSGMALRRAWGRCPQAVFLAGSPKRYLELSRRVRELLEARTPRVEPRSIDEFDVDLTGCERLLGDPSDVARSLRRVIREETGLVSSVGLACTPLVAKVATGESKPDGFLRVPAGEEAAFLAPLPIRKLPGVGPKTEERLLELGIQRIGDLVALDPEVLKAALGARGGMLSERARGGSARLEVGREIAPYFGGGVHTDAAVAAAPQGLLPPKQERLPKSISRAHTFAQDQDDRAVLDQALVRLVEAATSSLRSHQLRARTVTLAVRYADLQTVSRRARLPVGAQERQVLTQTRALLTALLRRRLRVRRLGVAFHALIIQHEQLRLFEGPRARSHRALGEAVDAIRARHGWSSVRMGSGEA